MSSRGPRVPDEVTRGFEVIRPHHPVVHIVANGVRGDSRVVKSALASMDEGLPTLVLGISLTADFEYFESSDVPVLLIPFASTDETQRQSGRSAEERTWRHRERRIAARRVVRATKGLRVRSLRSSRRSGQVISPSEPWWSERPGWLSINIALLDALDAIQPRLIHVHDTVPLPGAIAHAAAERLSGRSVHTIYDAHECCIELAESFPNSPMYRGMARIEAEFIRDASRVITVSTQIAQLIRETYRLRSTPLVVTNGPMRARDPGAPALRDVVGLDADVPLAVYSGWLAPERGLDTVMRAMPSLPDLHVALVVNGHSAELVSVLKLANTLGVLDRVHTAPYVVPSQITQYLSSADVGLIPRKPGRHLDLSLPTKFREYAHAGLPMVVSDNVAMAAEINRTKIGRVFKAGNVGGLSVQVGRVLAEPQRYRNRITDALLDQYCWETQARRLRPLYAGVALKTDPAVATFVADAFCGYATHATQPSGVPARASEATGPARDDSWQRGDPRHYGTKLGIGRANSAGQAFAWAHAVSEHLELPAESFGPVRMMQHPPDVPVRNTLNIEQGARELGRIASRYTYLLIDGFAPLFGPLMQGDLEREIDALRPHLFGLGLVAHGSEVRDPDAHLAAVDGSYFAHAPEAWVASLRDISSRNRALADRFDGPIFVSTPDLLSDLPRARWIPLVVDTQRWSGVEAPRFGRRLRVLHQPSRSDPPVKGTDVVHPVLAKLDAEGLIEYVRVDREIPTKDMPDLVARCDVVVDQIRTGSYGLAAVEAMMAGRVVIGHLSKAARNEVGDIVPVIDAPPKAFEDVLRGLAQSDRDELRSRGHEAREYVRRWHDGRKSAQVLLDGLLETTTGGR